MWYVHVPLIFKRTQNDSVCIYIYMCVCVCIYIYIYIYMLISLQKALFPEVHHIITMLIISLYIVVIKIVS